MIPDKTDEEDEEEIDTPDESFPEVAGGPAGWWKDDQEQQDNGN